MALVGHDLYVANTDAIVRFPYAAGATPDHRRRHRRSPTCQAGRSIITGPRTSSPVATVKLYVTVGSNSNVGENGMDNEENRAAILEIDPATRRNARLRIRACAIRTDWHGSRDSGALWTVGQ